MNSVISYHECPLCIAEADIFGVLMVLSVRSAVGQPPELGHSYQQFALFFPLLSIPILAFSFDIFSTSLSCGPCSTAGSSPVIHPVIGLDLLVTLDEPQRRKLAEKIIFRCGDRH